jgi:putative heme-binding domain-containing protein
MQTALLGALQAFDDPRIAGRVLEMYPTFSGDVRTRARGLLEARPSTALAMLRAVDAGAVKKEEVTLDEAQRLSRFEDEGVTRLLEKHWGKLRAGTPGEKMARISWLNIALSRGQGDAERGRVLFEKNCATCHKLFGGGNEIGPDLTGSDRKNRMYMLTHIVDPSAYIRPEYVAFQIETFDGRLLTGLVKDQTPDAVTLVDAKNQTTVISRADIDDMRASPVSLMPEQVLGEFDDEMTCDLFAYIQKDINR